MSDIRVGISGWRYVPWRGTFYPKGLVQKKELYFASRSVNSIELNGSFYALQTPERYTAWYTDVPQDFIFCVKAPRYITHILRLRDIEQAMANFFASGLLGLKEKLGCILWQFPPNFKFDKALFTRFLEQLPKTAEAAIACAEQCEPKLQRPVFDFLPKQRLRHSVEIRNESFRDPDFVALLRKFNVALVVADTAGRWPQVEDITSDFVYMRLHGDTELYRSGYSKEALEYWYQRIKTWSEGAQPDNAKLIKPLTAKAKQPRQRDVYCYFDNTDKLWAPYDARVILEKFNLAEHLEAEPGKPMAALTTKPADITSSKKPRKKIT